MLAAAVLASSQVAAPGRLVAQHEVTGPIAESYVSGLRWRSIGPYRSGNVSAVAGIAGDPTTYYIGTPEGGVWKTTSAGTVWSPVFDSLHVPSIGAVAVAQSHPATVVVGTGDPSGWSFTPGNGVYRSDDAGKSWRPMGLEKTRYISSVIIDPRNPRLILV